MIAAYLLVYLYVFWLLFLAGAALYASWKRMAVPVRILASPIVATLLVVDVLFNYTAATILFFEMPPKKCHTLTQRLSVYLLDNGWRSKVAHVICVYLLNPFQIGGHCK